jgi:ABC-type glutathione transport system ATPase component
VLAATHDLEVAAALCERGIVLHEGRILADAPLPEILGDAPLL